MFYTCMDLPSDISKLIEIEEFTDSIMHDCHLAECLRGRIALPLTEAVKNAIVHGNRADSSKKVCIICQQEAEKITFSVSDEGNGFSYREYMDGGKTAHTHGLAVMRSLCDELSFQNNGSTVVFRMHVPARQASPKHSAAFEKTSMMRPDFIVSNHESKH